MLRRFLLLCGLVSSLLYAGITFSVPAGWAGYSSSSQTISELSAFGAPTRVAWMIPAALYTVLITAFGLGVRQSAASRGRERLMGGLILAYGALGLLWPFASMHQRETLAAGGGDWHDTMHLVLAAVSVVLMLSAIAVSATAYGRAFRRYAIASLVLLVTFGVLTFVDAPGLSANRPTPWIGVWERINIGAFLLWVVVLAIKLLRSSDTVALREGPTAAAA